MINIWNMKKSVLVMIWTAAVMAMVSCDVVEGFILGSDAVPWRQDDEIVLSAMAADVEYAFTAREAWSVVSTDTGILTIASAASGQRGRNSITLRMAENSTGAERRANVVITVDGYEPEVLVSVVQSNTRNEDFDVIAQKIDPVLSQMYLWNDEYNTLSPDFDQTFDGFLENTLLSMKSNGEDGGVRVAADGTQSRYLYSYIRRSPRGSGSRSVIAKSPVVSFGIVNSALVMLLNQSGGDSGNRACCISGVYAGSAAAKAGIRRGSWIVAIDGRNLTAANINDAYSQLMSPAAGESVKLTVTDDLAGTNRRDITITAGSLALNPVLHAEVIETQAAKVGYLVYDSFDASFDDELLAEIRKFRNAGIDELVLDLRLNNGGHVISAQMLSSIIAGNSGTGKVCMKYEYNPSRMKDMGYAFPDKTDETLFGPYEGGSKYSSSDYLSLQRVWVLVTGSTASASELTFWSLRGIDFPVTLIGARTEGKNVGMEPQDFTYGNYDYTFYPITFRIYNAKNQSSDPSGVEPDYAASDWLTTGYADWGAGEDEMLAKALSLISGGSRAVTADSEQKSRTESAARLIAVPQRMGGGMIATPAE